MEMHSTTGISSVISGLKPYNNYTFQITPVNLAGAGKSSATVFCKTAQDGNLCIIVRKMQMLLYFKTEFFSVPSSPEILSGWATSTQSVYITWSQPKMPNGLLSHYNIFFR